MKQNTNKSYLDVLYVSEIRKDIQSPLHFDQRIKLIDDCYETLMKMEVGDSIIVSIDYFQKIFSEAKKRLPNYVFTSRRWVTEIGETPKRIIFKLK